MLHCWLQAMGLMYTWESIHYMLSNCCCSLVFLLRVYVWVCMYMFLSNCIHFYYKIFSFKREWYVGLIRLGCFNVFRFLLILILTLWGRCVFYELINETIYDTCCHYQSNEDQTETETTRNTTQQYIYTKQNATHIIH